MLNTFVFHSKFRARLFWIRMWLSGHPRAHYFESGRLQRRFHVAWA